ncbi:resolvase [Clostridium novyi]|nr:resolvase [Clostridium novyi]
MERRRVFAETYGVFKLDYVTLDNPFAGRVICGSCGGIFGRKTWHSTNENLRRKVWMCSNRYKVKGEKGCLNKHVDDKVLYQTFINIFNAIIENKDYFIEKWKDGLKSENVLVIYRSKQFIKIIEKAKPIKEFDVNLFLKVIEKMTVFEGEKIIVSLLDGTEIEAVIE